MNVPAKYVESLNLPCYMFDVKERLRPSSFMDLAQEIAAGGSAQLGVPDQVLLKHGLVWILARMKVEFVNLPKRLDSAMLETWHNGLDGLFFIRDYALRSPQGEAMVLASSSWIIMDVASRRVVRSDSLSDLIPAEPQCTEVALPPSEKLLPPAGCGMERVGEKTVLYSDVDYNGHANNAKYTQWAIDVLPWDVVTDGCIESLDINFNREAHPGEVVGLYHCFDGVFHYVEGRSAGSRIFIEKIKYNQNNYTL